ncbi:hypothetical protein [Streptomyces sp. GbtcB6]|uniref:hypothetical protein n=1 Tax=Streptomyces sp. GbtcB6 TaxID=2824751 RepID=UPI001C2F2B29|nr:hypothetical protein [Streptomyces sp. GbtcB6]
MVTGTQDGRAVPALLIGAFVLGPASKAYDPRTVRVAVALFGAAVLERIDDGILADGDKPTADLDGPGE